MTAPLLTVDNVAKHYISRSGVFGKTRLIRAVDEVSFTVGKGETLAIVGESGCGKSTVARLVSGLLPATSGAIRFGDDDIGKLRGQALFSMRKRVQMVFQDPMASLNARMTVGQILEEPLIIHRFGDRRARRDRVAELISLVGLRPEHAGRYPHQFSGGQKQRIGIARALAVEPQLLVLDEPVSALDVSVQAQMVNLLKDLQKRFGLSYIFIAHDLAVVRNIAERVAVMYLGKMVELGHREKLFHTPVHPYTRMLVAAVPRVGIHEGEISHDIRGEIPSPINLPSGCRFHPRCQYAVDLCSREAPAFKHGVACHLATELPPTASAPSMQHLTPGAAARMASYIGRVSATTQLGL